MKKLELSVGLFVALLALPLLIAPITITQPIAHRDYGGEFTKVMRLDEYGQKEWIAKGMLLSVLLGGMFLFCDACRRIYRQEFRSELFVQPTLLRSAADE